MRAQLKRTRNAFIPASEVDEETLSGIVSGDVVLATIQRVRNPDHHRLAMRLLRDCFENQDTYPRFENLLDSFKIEAGLIEPIIHPKTGDTVWKLQSISFAQMDQDEFSKVYDQFLDIAWNRYGIAMLG